MEGNKYARRVPVIINNQHFETIKAAADFIGINHNTVARRLKKGTEGYIYALLD